MALSKAAFKVTCWFHYGDDTFMIWLYGPEELKNFLIHSHIQFMMET